MADFKQLASLSLSSNRILRAGGLDLFEAEGYRWVCAESAEDPNHRRTAIQSAMRLAHPEEAVLPNHAAMVEASKFATVRRALDLGLGGAACYRALKHRLPGVSYTAVEYDPGMLSLARDYFAMPADFPVVVEDALRWVNRDRGTYDLVLCDLFSGEEAPEALAEPDFYRALAARLEPGGVAAINCLPESNESLLAVSQLLCEIFTGVAIASFVDLGNVVFYLRHFPFRQSINADSTNAVNTQSSSTRTQILR